MAIRQQFDHEQLDAYQVSLELIALIDKIVQDLPKGKAHIVDQLQRAGISIPLNIAEGAGEFSKKEKGRFYRIAKRSVTECASIFEICQRLKIVDENHYIFGRQLLLRLVAMLTKMSQIN